MRLKIPLIIKRFLPLSILLCAMNAQGADEVPCLVFTGESMSPSLFDMEIFKRVYVGEDSFIVHAPDNTEYEDTELPYSLFNRLEFKSSSLTDGVQKITAQNESSTVLRYVADSHALCLTSESSSVYKTGIFTTSGTLVATTSLKGGQSVSVQQLTPGMYVAVATNGAKSYVTKFIIK